MLILDDKDKANISLMQPDATKYCSFPASEDEKTIKEFMKTNA